MSLVTTIARPQTRAPEKTLTLSRFRLVFAAHFAVGAVKSLITLRSWWASGLEMTIVGIIEAAVTYGLGLAFGAIS